MCDFCEGVMGDCVREECTDVATVTIANAQQEWQLQENARILEEVKRVVAMEIGSEVVNEQVSQVGAQVMRYCPIFLIMYASHNHFSTSPQRELPGLRFHGDLHM